MPNSAAHAALLAASMGLAHQLTAMGGGDTLPKDADMRLVMRAMALDKPRGPEVIASVIAMLASEDGAHINGEEIRVDGGTLS